MNIFIIIIGIIGGLLITNAALLNKFEELTAYKKNDKSWLSLRISTLYIFFGIFMFPFYKTIREYLKIRYIKKEIEYFEIWQKLLEENNFKGTQHDYDQYINYKRYLKLRKLKRKI